MSVPTLFIERLRPGLYGWRMSAACGLAASHGADTSLAQCLDRALNGMPMQAGLVEIIYCEVPMGTMDINEVRRTSSEIALQIKSLHSALLETA